MEKSLRRQHKHWLVTLASLAILAFSLTPAIAQPRFTNVAQMVSATIPAGMSGQQVIVSGRLTANDGGGGIFVYDSASATATNLGTIFKPSGSTGRWIRQYSGSVNAQWFGAVGDDATDNITQLQAALDFVATSSQGGSLFIPEGVYLVSGTLSVTNGNVSIVGESSQYGYGSTVATPPFIPRTSLQWTSGGTNAVALSLYVSNVSYVSYCELKNLDLVGRNAIGYGIRLAGAHIVENCNFREFQTAAIHSPDLINSTHFSKCSIFGNFNYAVLIQGPSATVFTFEDCNINQNRGQQAVRIESAYNAKFQNCVIESNWGYGMVLYKPATNNIFAFLTLDKIHFEGNNYIHLNTNDLVIDSAVAGGDNGYALYALPAPAKITINDSQLQNPRLTRSIYTQFTDCVLGTVVVNAADAYYTHFDRCYGNLPSMALGVGTSYWKAQTNGISGWEFNGSMSNPGDRAFDFLMGRGGGFNWVQQASGAISGAANAGGGNMILKSGISTGSAGSQIEFWTPTPGGAGSTDRSPSLKAYIAPNGSLAFNQASDISTASGALNIIPAAGNNFNVSLSGTGDFTVNTSQLYVDTSNGSVGMNTTDPLNALYTGAASDRVFAIASPSSSSTGPGIKFANAGTASGLNIGTMIGGSSACAAAEKSASAVILQTTASNAVTPSGDVQFWTANAGAISKKWAVSSAGNMVGIIAGTGIQIKEGSNARMGATALVNGTVTVSNTSVTANTRIFLTRRVRAGTTVGILGVGTITAATSFVIESVDLAGALSADDDSTVNWLLVEPSP